MRRRWRWTPRRCVVCRTWLPRHRWRLGMNYCSAVCFRERPFGYVCTRKDMAHG